MEGMVGVSPLLKYLGTGLTWAKGVTMRSSACLQSRTATGHSSLEKQLSGVDTVSQGWKLAGKGAGHLHHPSVDMMLGLVPKQMVGGELTQVCGGGGCKAKRRGAESEDAAGAALVGAVLGFGEQGCRA